MVDAWTESLAKPFRRYVACFRHGYYGIPGWIDFPRCFKQRTKTRQEALNLVQQLDSVYDSDSDKDGYIVPQIESSCVFLPATFHPLLRFNAVKVYETMDDAVRDIQKEK